jgi:acyl-CoA thioesterase
MSTPELPKVLQVNPAGENRYTVNHPTDDPEARNVVFSGQILAQMIMAADHAVDGAKDTKSIHGIFARAATYTDPLELALDTMQAGRAWASHTLTATQNGKLMSRGMVLQNSVEPDIMRHGPAMPKVPGPGGVDEVPMLVFPGAETRPVVDPEATAPDGTPARSFWLRYPGGLPSVAANQAVLAWCEPGMLIELAMRPHAEAVNIREAHVSISTGVIAHTAHFHERFDLGDWLLVAQQATFAGNGRVFGSGTVFTADGTLVATFEQDAMVRKVDAPLDPKRSMLTSRSTSWRSTPWPARRRLPAS